MNPVLAGRDARKIEPIAAQLDCPSRVFHLSDVREIAGQLAGVRAVLHCAGPFSQTARPMIDACLEAGVHFLGPGLLDRRPFWAVLKFRRSGGNFLAPASSNP